MGRSGGDDAHEAGPRAEGPEPSELWIDAGGTAGPGGARRYPGGPPRGSGGRGRWMALTAGFAVLVAVIAVQHFAGGTVASPPDSSSRPVAPSPTSTPGTAASPIASPTPAWSMVHRGTPEPTGTPGSSGAAGPSGNGAVVGTSAPDASGGAGTETTVRITDTTSPTTTAVPRQAPGAIGWELVGYGPLGLVRYLPATGAVTVTPVPGLDSTGPVSFIATPTAAVIRPLDLVSGYLVPAGSAATPLRGQLAAHGPALPGPRSGQLWVQADSGDLVLVDLHGAPIGPRISPPPNTVNGWPQPDGAGYAMSTGVGGVYDLRPDGARLITHGTVLAAGPSTYLAYECDDRARCHTVVIDRTSGPVATAPPITIADPQLVGGGAVSADGALAAIVRPEADRDGAPVARVTLIDLRAGTGETLPMPVGPGNSDPALTVAFTPDGRYLLVATMSGRVDAVNVRTRQVTPLPAAIPPMTMLAVIGAG